MRAVLLSALVSIVAVTLPGCTTGVSPPRATTPIGAPIQMAPGQQLALPDGAALRYLEVAADSRCPPGAQCIRAGDADVVFEFTDTAQPLRRITVNTDPPAMAAIGQWQLKLLALAFGKAPKATVRIDPAAGQTGLAARALRQGSGR